MAHRTFEDWNRIAREAAQLAATETPRTKAYARNLRILTRDLTQTQLEPNVQDRVLETFLYEFERAVEDRTFVDFHNVVSAQAYQIKGTFGLILGQEDGRIRDITLHGHQGGFGRAIRWNKAWEKVRAALPAKTRVDEYVDGVPVTVDLDEVAALPEKDCSNCGASPDDLHRRADCLRA